MKRSTVTTLAAALTLALGTSAYAASITQAEYQASRTTIEADHTAAKAGCDSLAANAKDICVAQAKGKQNVALAELEAAYQPSAKATYDVRVAKAQADYAVAKEKCDDQAGNPKDVCVKRARSVRTAAKADAKAHMKVVDARHEAAVDKRAAEYAVAKEKCDALAGNAKDTCVSNAKARYTKS